MKINLNKCDLYKRAQFIVISVLKHAHFCTLEFEKCILYACARVFVVQKLCRRHQCLISFFLSFRSLIHSMLKYTCKKEICCFFFVHLSVLMLSSHISVTIWYALMCDFYFCCFFQYFIFVLWFLELAERSYQR